MERGEAGDKLKRVVYFVKIKPPTIVRNLRIIRSEFTFAYSYPILQQKHFIKTNAPIEAQFYSELTLQLYKCFLPILSQAISKQRDTSDHTGPVRTELRPKITHQIKLKWNEKCLSCFQYNKNVKHFLYQKESTILQWIRCSLNSF